MNFSDKLNEYMDLLDCSPKDICNISGLSPTIISRYINGKRTPRIKSEYFEKIVDSICQIASNDNINLSREDVSKSLSDSILSSNIDFDVLISNVNTLFFDLNINNSDFAKAMGYDASFISKIRNKSRKPYDLEGFADGLSNYIAKISVSSESRKIILNAMGLPDIYKENMALLKKDIYKWLITSHLDNNIMVQNFLTTIDNFDLNSYINMDFSKIKVPTSPVILRNSKTFYGKER